MYNGVWEFVGFKELLSSNNRYSLGKVKKKDYHKKGKYPIIDQGQEFIAGYTDKKELAYSGKLPVVVFGDHTLVVKYVDFPFVQGADGIKLLLPNKNIYPKYLYYLVLFFRPIDGKYARHFKKLREIKWPLPFKDGQPDIAEQKRIADKLDKLFAEIDKAIKNTQAALEDAEKILQSELQKIFRKELKKEKEFRLKNVAEIIMGQSPSSATYNMRNEGLPFFQGKADFSDINPIPRVYCTSPKKIAKEGDVLISVRAPVGPVNIADKRYCIGRGLAAIRSKNILPKFLFYFFRYFEPNWIGRGSTFKSIKKEDLWEISVNLPSTNGNPDIGKQQCVVDRLDRIYNQSRQLIEKYREQLDCWLKLKQSLLNQAFRGEL